MVATSVLVNQIRDAAQAEGFATCGIAPAVTSEGFSDLVRWIDAGYAAGMDYFQKRLDAYQHPSGVLPGARSVIALAFPYDPRPTQKQGTDQVNQGRVARYTWQGVDYHDVIHPKLKRLCRLIQQSNPDANARGVVDTAPIMEREVAMLAGLGWQGKNTLLLNKTLGSYFFLACVLVDIELPSDAPHTSSHCGTCSACLDACPTDAFVGPHILDASKCISYLTIENKDSIPEPLREGVGDWVFGCDVCQEVCPWNRKPSRLASQQAEETDGQAVDGIGRGFMDLLELFELNEDQFRTQFRRSPMWRTRRRGMLRNAAIVLGNIGDRSALPTLRTAAKETEPLIRDAACWAIGQILERDA